MIESLKNDIQTLIEQLLTHHAKLPSYKFP